MKIYMNNKLYISKKDIFYLVTHETNIPKNIENEIIIANNNNTSFIIDENNKDDFMVLTSDEAKDYFRKIDYILNLGSYKNYDTEYLYQLLVVASKHRIALLDTFCKYDEQQKVANMGIRKKIDDLNQFLIGLNDLIEIKENKSRIILPIKERKNYYQEKEEKAKEFLIKMMQPVKYY